MGAVKSEQEDMPQAGQTWHVVHSEKKRSGANITNGRLIQTNKSSYLKL